MFEDILELFDCAVGNNILSDVVLNSGPEQFLEPDGEMLSQGFLDNLHGSNFLPLELELFLLFCELAPHICLHVLDDECRRVPFAQ